jgi:hypothetical protein
VTRRHPSSLVWFRLASGDLHAHEWLGLQWHVFRCSECRARLQRERIAFASVPPPPSLPGLSSYSSKVRAGWRVPALAGAVFVATLWVFVVRMDLGSEQGAREDLTPKGSSSFELRQVDADATSRPLSGRCHAGQRVQPTVESSHRYVIIIAIEPSGEARPLFPREGEQSAVVPKSEKGRLPESWTFDATPGTERFVAFFTDAPLSRTEALKLAQARGRAPSGIERVERSCEKPSHESDVR